MKRLPAREQDSSASKSEKKPVTPREKKPAEGLPLWRRLAILLCLLGFVVFLCPVVARIVNLANVSAMAGFLILAAVFRWWPNFLGLLRRIWTRRLGRVLLVVTGLALASLLVLVLVLCCEVAACLREVPEEPCPTAIVLGCQVRGTTPSRLLSYRIQAAADYLNDNPGAAAILSGGQGAGESVSEARCMYDSLVARGIDPARLYLEEDSTITLENLQNSKALMEREGLSGPAVLVSNDFHIFRALTMAGDIGLDARGLAAKSLWFSRPTYVLREALAMIKYAVIR